MWLTQPMWNTCLDMEDVLQCFKGICTSIITKPISVKLGTQNFQVNPEEWEGYFQEDVVDTKKSEAEEEANLESTKEESSVEDEGEKNEEETSDSEGKSQGDWIEKLTMFQKLCIVKSFKEEKVHLFCAHGAVGVNYLCL